MLVKVQFTLWNAYNRMLFLFLVRAGGGTSSSSKKIQGSIAAPRSYLKFMVVISPKPTLNLKLARGSIEP